MNRLLTKLPARSFGTSKVLKESLSEPLRKNAVVHDDSSWKKWKNIFIFLCVPSMCLAYVNCALSEHLPPPEFKKYPYLRIRNKQYPWGDGNRTLFFNPHVNPLPDGYIESH